MKKYFFFIYLIAFNSYAFDESHLNRLLQTKTCEYCDLSNADLRKKNLQKAKLTGSNLSGTNFSGTNLKEADLSFTNLSNSTGYIAKLYKANLEGADLTGVKLNGADLKNSNFSDANLSKSNLSNTDAAEIVFDGCNLKFSKHGSAMTRLLTKVRMITVAFYALPRNGDEWAELVAAGA